MRIETSLTHIQSLPLVIQVLTEVAGETLGQMAAAPQNKVAAAPVATEAEEEEEDAEAADLQARLDAIRS